MIKKSICFMFIALITLGFYANADETGVNYRALLIGCDDFVSYDDTFQTSYNNITMMSEALARDSRGFKIHSQSGITQNKAALKFAIDATIGKAGENDVSYFYISTHGVLTEPYDDGESGFALVLSDGFEEELLHAFELRDMLSGVAGTLVVIVESCYAGRLAEALADSDIVVIASSLANEKSWFWNAGDNDSEQYYSVSDGHQSVGESYFTQAFAAGIGRFDEFAADANRDAGVTLAEFSAYIKTANAASVALVEHGASVRSDFVLFKYIKPNQSQTNRTLLTGFAFGGSRVSASRNALTFSFVINENVRVAYQFVPRDDKTNEWDWSRATLWIDKEFTGADSSARFPLRVSRTVTLAGVPSGDSGEIMLSVAAFDAAGHLAICSSRIIYVDDN